MLGSQTQSKLTAMVQTLAEASMTVGLFAAAYGPFLDACVQAWICCMWGNRHGKGEHRAIRYGQQVTEGLRSFWSASL